MGIHIVLVCPTLNSARECMWVDMTPYSLGEVQPPKEKKKGKKEEKKKKGSSLFERPTVSRKKRKATCFFIFAYIRSVRKILAMLRDTFFPPSLRLKAQRLGLGRYRTASISVIQVFRASGFFYFFIIFFLFFLGHFTQLPRGDIRFRYRRTSTRREWVYRWM